MSCDLHGAARVVGAEEEEGGEVAGDAVGEPVLEHERGNDYIAGGNCKPNSVAVMLASPIKTGIDSSALRRSIELPYKCLCQSTSLQAV